MGREEPESTAWLLHYVEPVRAAGGGGFFAAPAAQGATGAQGAAAAQGGEAGADRVAGRGTELV